MKIEISATRKMYIENSNDNFADSISGCGLLDNPAIRPLLLHWLHCNPWGTVWNVDFVEYARREVAELWEDSLVKDAL